MDPKMECVASECNPNRYSNTALVIAWPRWFKEYKGEPVYVSQFPPTSFIGFKAVLKDEISPRYWIDSNRREHKWFRYERLIPAPEGSPRRHSLSKNEGKRNGTN